MTKAICSIDDCPGRVVAWSMCDKHYRRWKKWDDPHKVLVIQGGTDEERFWQYVNRNGPLPGAHTLAAGRGRCWLWTGGSHTSGPGSEEYGTFRFDRKPGGAHRFSYRLHTGPLMPGMEIDHLCRVTLCVNPGHLEQVIHRTNALRGIGAAAQASRRLHCPQGHEYTEENTYSEPNNPRHRECRTCIRARSKVNGMLEPVPVLPCPVCGTPFKARKSPTTTGRKRSCSYACGQRIRQQEASRTLRLPSPSIAGVTRTLLRTNRAVGGVTDE